MSLYTLGISAFFHDSAAALLRDGEIIAAAQEERFTRKKGDARFPSASIAYCLDYAGIKARELSQVLYYEKPFVKFERILKTYLSAPASGLESFQYALPAWATYKLDLPAHIRSRLEDYRGSILMGDHHESHAASAFFPSPFADAAILTIDAVGEWSTSSLGFGNENRIELFKELTFPSSVGMLYSAFTYYCGFKVNSGEYKLMGLAPYGEPKYADLIREKIVDIAPDGSIALDMSYFDYQHGLTMTSDKFHELFGGPPREREAMLTQKDMDLAASIQVICEEVVLKMADHANRVTGSRNLVLSGGVALNCVANGRVLRESPFERIWIQPAAGDAGGALGCALLGWHHVLNKPRNVAPGDSQKGSLLGPAYGNDDIGIYLQSVGAKSRIVPDEDELIALVADLLSKEKVVGWFHGRMEYGPRSLGARSIIGDARSRDMQQKMNLKIKFRESFRPFAPCVLREHAHEIFEMRPEDESPYMLLVAPVVDELRTPLDDDMRTRMADPDLRVRVAVPRSRYPAITHVDYSARVQTVDEGRHGRFYRLMKRFRDLTGSPVVVNTSFNVRGEPIVLSPEDAFQCFMATDMDCLVLENHLLLKDDQASLRKEDRERYIAQYELD
jgi:carbamoyltransferase